MEKVVVKGDSFSEEIFESVFENEDFESVMSGDFKLNVSKVSFHPTNVPKSSFGIENINSLAMELDSELLESEDFDLNKLSIGLSENLEILEFNVSIQDWNNPMYLPVGTYLLNDYKSTKYSVFHRTCYFVPPARKKFMFLISILRCLQC